MSNGTEYTRKQLQQEALSAVRAVRLATQSPARLEDWLIGGVGTTSPYLKVLVYAYDGLRQINVAI